MDYYSGDNIPQGLKEIKYFIKQYVVHNECGDWCEMEEDIENELKKIKTPLYYKELLKCLDNAIELIEKND